MTQTPFLILQRLLLSVLVLLQGCATTSGPSIQTSPLPAFKYAHVYWVDDNQVLFIGKDESASHHILNLYLWNVVSSSTTVVAEDMNGALCFNRGYVVYGKWTSRYLFSGPLNNAQEESTHRGGIHSFLTCKSPPTGIHRVYESNNPQWYLIQLLEEHGVLERPPEKIKNGIAYLHVPNKSEPIPIPSLDSMNTIFIRDKLQFHQHMGAYLITGSDNKSIRWLFPDGRVLELPIPSGPWRANQWNSAYLPVKGAVIAFDWDHRGKGNSVLQGAYLVRDGSYVNFLPSNYFMSLPAVSPNGCRVAFHFWKPNGNEQNRIGVLDVCTR